MNTTIHAQAVEKNWAELKKKIMSKWDKFGDQEVESVKSNLSDLADKIQKTYGIGKDSAVQQFDEFRKSVQSLISPEASAPAPAAAEATKPTLVTSAPAAAPVKDTKVS